MCSFHFRLGFCQETSSSEACASPSTTFSSFLPGYLRCQYFPVCIPSSFKNAHQAKQGEVFRRKKHLWHKKSEWQTLEMWEKHCDIWNRENWAHVEKAKALDDEQNSTSCCPSRVHFSSMNFSKTCFKVHTYYSTYSLTKSYRIRTIRSDPTSAIIKRFMLLTYLGNSSSPQAFSSTHIPLSLSILQSRFTLFQSSFASRWISEVWSVSRS